MSLGAGIALAAMWASVGVIGCVRSSPVGAGGVVILAIIAAIVTASVAAHS